MKKNTLSSRREFIKRSSQLSMAALGGLALSNPSAAASDRREEESLFATGRVFHDIRRDGVANGQPGIEGVLVSNGKDIVMTDLNGNYTLPVSDDTIIHVIKPRGYATKVDGLMLPRFYYIHKPEGSPDDDFLYQGIEATGPLPSSIDFPLYQQVESETFDVLITADPQPYHLDHIKYYAKETTRAFSSLPAVFAIALGDIVGDHLDLYDPYNRINAKCGFPWHNVIGNHDLNFMAREDRYADETFKRVFGPTTYAFQYSKVHFIVLNNIYWEGFTQLRADGWPRRGQYRGHIRPQQFEYIRNYLKHVPADERIVICSHIPLINHADIDKKHETAETRQLMQLLSGHRYTLSFSGHTHINMNYFLDAADGYRAPGGAKHHHCNLTATCGSWYRGPLDVEGIPFSPGRDGSPKGYAVVRFKGAEDYHVDVRSLGLPENDRMSISFPQVVETGSLGNTEIHVNVFAGSSQTVVRMRLDDGKWISMDQTSSEDPAYLALRDHSIRHPQAGQGELPAAMVTDHQWKAKLPSGLKPGWHTISVEARMISGERWLDQRTFAVVEKAADLDHLNQGTRTPG